MLHDPQFMSSHKRRTGQKCRNRCMINLNSKNLTWLICVNSSLSHDGWNEQMNLHGGKDETRLKSRRYGNHKYIYPSDFSLTHSCIFFTLSEKNGFKIIFEADVICITLQQEFPRRVALL